MKLISAEVYLETLREYEDKMGTKSLEKILGEWFGEIGIDVALQALDNYRNGLEGPVHELNIEISSNALQTVRGLGIKIPRKHKFFSRLRYLFFG